MPGEAELYKKLCTSKAPVPVEVREAVEFLEWKIDPECVGGAARKGAIYGFLAGLVFVVLYILTYAMNFGFGAFLEALVFDIATLNPFTLLVLFLPIILAFIAYFMLLYYPVMKKEEEMGQILLELPEVMGYVVLSLKLSPNLERALSFAADNSEGVLANRIKKLIWEMRMGVYASAEEALDHLIYRVGANIPELKHALMQIRASTLEPDDARRNFRLDRALDDIITSVRNRLEERASSMYMPSIQLFYLGVFLPLLLFVILPVASAFSDLPLATLPSLVAIYIIGLPLIIYIFSRSILSKRPNIYKPPVPPKEKDRKHLYIAIAAAIVVLSISYILHLQLDITYERAEALYCGYEGCLREKYGFTSWEDAKYIDEVSQILSSYDTTPYWLIFGALLAPVVAISIYFFLSERARAKRKEEIMEMEGEFKDVVYLMASKMGEGKPLEGALESVINLMPNSKLVREVFSKILYNIRVMGLSLGDAVFHPLFGALRHIPSHFLKKATSTVVKSVELGTELAARALIAFSDQLRKEEEIIRMLRSKMGEIYIMITSMVLFVSPIVLGITVALQQVIVSSLYSVEAPEVPEEYVYQLNISVPKINELEGKVASPAEFLTIAFLYNIILTFLLTIYSVKLYEGEDPIAVRRALARNLLISSLLFILSTWVSLSIIRGVIV